MLIVGSEAQPFAKTGGLADVLGALPSALARLGWAATLVMPKYRGVAGGTRVDAFPVAVGGLRLDVSVHETPLGDGARALLVECPELYDRDALYGSAEGDYPDNARRFGLLSRAALEFVARQAVPISVVHAHDWQAGLTPVLLRPPTASGPLAGVPAVFTIHNLAYQGIFDASWLNRLDLDPALMSPEALEYWGRISFLKAGIVFSQVITTVSPTYALEIQTSEYGFGFEGLLRSRAADLIGILNGIDYDQWDPSRDPYLPTPYDAAHLEPKRAAKKLVLRSVGLPDAEERRPLVGLISRLVDQKGFDLLAEIGDELPRLGASFVVLGTGEARYEELWRRLAAKYPDRIAVRIGFDEAMAHRIEGGADLFLMPSRFEPCGLNQMYSLRYGTVPVVRATGGLADTVRNVDPATGEGTGFTFEAYTAEALLAALRRALHAYQDEKAWRRIQNAGMRQDFSWEASARQYVEVYKRATMGQ